MNTVQKITLWFEIQINKKSMLEIKITFLTSREITNYVYQYPVLEFNLMMFYFNRMISYHKRNGVKIQMLRKIHIMRLFIIFIIIWTFLFVRGVWVIGLWVDPVALRQTFPYKSLGVIIIKDLCVGRKRFVNFLIGITYLFNILSKVNKNYCLGIKLKK